MYLIILIYVKIPNIRKKCNFEILSWGINGLNLFIKSINGFFGLILLCKDICNFTK
jgi:hypothetical protein